MVALGPGAGHDSSSRRVRAQRRVSVLAGDGRSWQGRPIHNCETCFLRLYVLGALRAVCSSLIIVNCVSFRLRV